MDAARGKRMRTLLSQAPTMVAIMLGPNYVFDFANSAFLEHIGRKTPEEIQGKPLAEVIPEILHQPLKPILDKVFATGETFRGFEFPVHLDVHHDGELTLFYVNFSYQALRETDGTIGGVFLWASDVTDLVEARYDLEKANNRLMTLSRNIEEYAYVTIHDLQEPLRMISVYSELMLRCCTLNENPEMAEFGSYVKAGVHRMDNLIQDLLQYSRAAYSQEAPPHDPVDLNDVIEECLTILRTRTLEAKAEFQISRLPTVLGDREQYVQLFQNLISNALKYRVAERPTKITIGVEDDGSTWTIFVADNGIGFAQADAEKIFGLFKRLHADEYPGTGVGLSIVKRIVERFDGRIWAIGTPNVGSTFFVELPKK
jgi:PAS domain S-box-containing protein